MTFNWYAILLEAEFWAPATSAVNPDPDSMGSLDPYSDPDPGGKKLAHKNEKS